MIYFFFFNSRTADDMVQHIACGLGRRRGRKQECPMTWHSFSSIWDLHIFGTRNARDFGFWLLSSVQSHRQLAYTFEYIHLHTHTMAFSWSQIAAPAAGTPKVISIASNAPATAASAPADNSDHEIATDATTAPSSAAPLAPAPSSSGPAISPEPTQSDVQPEAGPSRPAAPRLKHLILDAGPLLSLTPLRHLAEAYHTTPAVLAELRDPKAREYWDRLALQGVDVRVEQPSPESMARVMAFARKTGDYAVLSQTDLGVVALTLQYEVKENGEVNVRSQPGEKKGAAASGQTQKGPKGQSGSGKEGLADVAEAEVEGAQDDDEVSESEDEEDDEAVEAAGDGVESENEAATPIHTETDHEATTEASAGDLSQTLDSTHIAPPPAEHSAVAEISTAGAGASAAAQESDPESDGEWITPSNLTKHRSKDLGLLPSTSPNASQVQLAAAAMTGDFAVQNVLLAMGLGLVGEGGKRIAKVKSWVLRCHACFKYVSIESCSTSMTMACRYI